MNSRLFELLVVLFIAAWLVVFSVACPPPPPPAPETPVSEESQKSKETPLGRPDSHMRDDIERRETIPTQPEIEHAPPPPVHAPAPAPGHP